MYLRDAIIGFVLTALVSMPFATAEAGGIGKAVARGASKGVAKSVKKGLAQKLRQDLVRDRATPVRFLKRDTRVFRYTTNARAQRELRSGLRPGSHVTSKASPGRPLSAANAKSKYGLPTKPEKRETLLLPKGTAVRRNKTLGGKPGVPEMSLPGGTSPSSIEKNVFLR